MQVNLEKIVSYDIKAKYDRKNQNVQDCFKLENELTKRSAESSRRIEQAITEVQDASMWLSSGQDIRARSTEEEKHLGKIKA